MSDPHRGARARGPGAVRQPVHDLRPPRPRCSSTASSAAPTCCAGWVLAESAAGRTVVQLDGAGAITTDLPSTAAPGQRVLLSVRPEAIQLSAMPAPDAIGGRVVAVIPIGPALIYQVAIARRHGGQGGAGPRRRPGRGRARRRGVPPRQAEPRQRHLPRQQPVTGAPHGPPHPHPAHPAGRQCRNDGRRPGTRRGNAGGGDVRRHLGRGAEADPGALFHKAHRLRREPGGDAGDRADRQADRRQGGPAAVRRRHPGRGAGARGDRCRADREIRRRQVARLRRAAAAVPGRIRPRRHHAGDRHRVQPEDGEDAAHQLGRSVAAGVQGPRRHHLARQLR